MLYGINTSYMEMVDTLIHPYLEQQGSRLMGVVTQIPVVGDSFGVRQRHVGEAHWRDGQGEKAQDTVVGYDKRIIRPRGFSCRCKLDTIDVIKQGIPDAASVAQDLSNSCGKRIDEIIIGGIGGASYSEGRKENIFLSGAKNIKSDKATDKEKLIAEYDKTQTIAWNDCTLTGNIAENSRSTNAGLSVSKLAKAVQKLRSKHAYGQIWCVASEYAASTYRADERAANMQYNMSPVLATSQNAPIAGVNGFITSQLVDTGKSAVKVADGTYISPSAAGAPDVEYAYVFVQEHIMLGCSMPLTLDQGQDPTEYFNQVIQYTGMYGCTRMFEDAVVRIEILKGGVADDSPFVN